MKPILLKFCRICIALCFFVPFVLFFCDFAGILPKKIQLLMSVQLTPAILSGSLVTIALLLILTLLFGRIYCAVLCPLGVLQDIIARIRTIGKRKQVKKRRYRYSRPQNVLRYLLLGLCIVLRLFGILVPVLMLDPYSNFGRIATNLFRPVVIFGNNLLNEMATKAGNYSFYHVTIYTVTAVSFLSALFVFLVVAIMALFRGRLFCNTICPAGSLLGLVSRYSLFRITVDHDRCNNCHLCERVCKSQCIDSKSGAVDGSRCVTCFNCLSRCSHRAIDYRFTPRLKPQPATPSGTQSLPSDKAQSLQQGRRTFLLTGATIAMAIPAIPTTALTKSPVDDSKLKPITPPGSKSLLRFKEKCTGCHLCVTHCPQQILKPADFAFGFDYFLKPHLVYDHAYCNYECTVCSEVCPNGAIVPFTESETKQTTQVGVAKFTAERCVVPNRSTDCGACSEHCPTQAVHMIPYRDGLRIPQVTPELCIGCGGCEYICPVRPLKAINVVANEVHQAAHLPTEEETEQPAEIEDFGF